MWYIFRHGETFCNRNKKRQGYSRNSFLTLEGILQSHMNGLKLKNLEKDFAKYKFLCSPLERAHHTCQLILDSLEMDTDPIIEELLLSRSRGKIDKYHEEEIKEYYPEEWQKIQDNLWGYKFEDYESYKELYLRLAKFIDKYKNEKNLVVVAHKGLNRNLMFLLKKSLEIEDLTKWINSLNDDEGNKMVKNLKERVKGFNQNYFYSWDWNEFIRI